MKTPKQNQKGFTLIELIIALMVFGIISVISYGTLNSILTSRDQVKDHSERLRVLQTTMTIMERDLTQAAERSIRDPFGDSQPALQSNLTPFLFTLTRSGWHNPANRKRSQLQRVGYQLEEGQLVRWVWPVLDQVQGQEPMGSVLIEEIENIEVRYLDEQLQWQPAWPPTLSNEEEPPVLPVAIEIKLTLNDWGSISRLFQVTG